MSLLDEVTSAESIDLYTDRIVCIYDECCISSVQSGKWEVMLAKFMEDILWRHDRSLHSVQVARALFGLRSTAGSTSDFPPDERDLMKAFKSKHTLHGVSILTVGARALSKHALRSRERWWGRCEGSEAAKNSSAEQLAKYIILHAVWLNCHSLPHDIHIFELRVPEGYGMRWSVDGFCFRGFLEPVMNNGHTVGWHH